MRHSTELKKERENFILNNVEYEMIHFSKFNYDILHYISHYRRAGKGDSSTYNDVVIMADTETSKKAVDTIGENHVVAFTISIRAYSKNICTLWGDKPSEMVTAISKILLHMAGDKTIIYVQNLSYDWVFIRKFLFSCFGLPNKQLNTKSHYPIMIEWENGLILKDSLILSQRSLEKWGKDLNVEHQKAVGKWDYNKIRTQHEIYSTDELKYIEFDTLCGVECIDTLMKSLHKKVYSMPYTATGIPREEVRKRGKKAGAKQLFNRLAITYEQYKKLEQVYHGGYTHANRHVVGWVLGDEETIIEAYDFASSYPFVLLSEKYPCEKFNTAPNCSIYQIINDAENYAFMFKLIAVGVRLKNDFIEMPSLQFSKCVKIVNGVTDNGRVLCADYIEIYLTEMDLKVIAGQYDFYKHICTEVEYAYKDYLPHWFTDYIYELFRDKTVYKDGDQILYMLQKGKLNSLYGMCVQKCIKETIEEMYLSGEYEKKKLDEAGECEIYEQYLANRNSILPYSWGVWCTSYAFYNLFQLGACCEKWLYSDTDSCYGINWNKDKIAQYNQKAIEKLHNNGYEPIEHNGKQYSLGVAEFDGAYSEFVVLGSKRYCGRQIKDMYIHHKGRKLRLKIRPLKITVAGVPKTGVKCLNNDISNFKEGLIFSGKITNKKTHTYFFTDDIYIDENGNETGDSIDLSPCDYLLDRVENMAWEDLISEEINIQIAGEIELYD